MKQAEQIPRYNCLVSSCSVSKFGLLPEFFQGWKFVLRKEITREITRISSGLITLFKWRTFF